MSTSAPAVSAAARSAAVLGQDLPFWYPINVTLTANQSGIAGNVTTDNDADFELRELIASSTGALHVATVVAIKPGGQYRRDHLWRQLGESVWHRAVAVHPADSVHSLAAVHGGGQLQRPERRGKHHSGDLVGL